MIDIHCHLLYGVDDGAEDRQMSVAMLRDAAEQGIQAIILTPHYRQGMFKYPLEEIRAAYEDIYSEAEKLGVMVYLGCEYHADGDTGENFKNGRCLTLADSDHVLVEFKYESSIGFIRNTLNDLLAHGYTPVIAHAERYGPFMPQNPINPYGATKLMVERIFKDYNRAYGLQFVVFRYFNAAGADPDGEIGESHNPETHIIPLVLNAASGLRPDVKVFGTDYDTPDGSCVRDYIHVTDLASAHVLALHHLEDGKPSDFFNLGNERGTSVLEVVESVRRVTGKEFTATLADRRHGDPAKLVGYSRKVQEILGWKPKYTDIDTIVLHAWKWHEEKEY